MMHTRPLISSSGSSFRDDAHGIHRRRRNPVGSDLDHHSSDPHESAFDDMIPILGGGTFFFVVIVPAGLFRRPRK
jgi:hypothetical protein